jgi:signal transduction histidine kinase
VAHALSSAVNEADVHWVTVRAAADALGTARATLFMVRDSALEVVADCDDAGVDLRGTAVSLADHPAVAGVVATGRPWAGSLEATSWRPENPGLVGLRSGAFAALQWDGKVGAVLGTTSRSPRQFSPSDLQLLQELAIVSGLSLRSIGRYRREHEHVARLSSLEQMKGEFLNLASHELRGPLSVLNGYLAMLSEGSLGAITPKVEAVHRILAAKVKEMTEMVEEMLETARLEERTVELDRVRIDLRDVARALTEEWRRLAAPTQQLLLEATETPALVDADDARVRTIIANLLSNAIKYSPGGGEIVCDVSTAGDVVKLVVTDHGLGIAPEDLPHLFTRFGRVVTRETSHIPGTGLGLYLSRGLARAHGGDVTVATAVGKGSAFTLCLPLAAGVPEAGGGSA